MAMLLSLFACYDVIGDILFLSSFQGLPYHIEYRVDANGLASCTKPFINNSVPFSMCLGNSGNPTTVNFSTYWSNKFYYYKYYEAYGRSWKNIIESRYYNFILNHGNDEFAVKLSKCYEHKNACGECMKNCYTSCSGTFNKTHGNKNQIECKIESVYGNSKGSNGIFFITDNRPVSRGIKGTDIQNFVYYIVFGTIIHNVPKIHNTTFINNRTLNSKYV